MKQTIDTHEAFAYTGGRPFVAGQPCIAFVHGGGLDHSVWILQSRYFAHHGYNVLAFDLPGHGRSGGDPLPSIEEMADWCARFLDAAEVASAAVVGHSMGSLVALEFGARHPERTWMVGLIGISTPMPVTDRLLDAARADDHAAFDMVNIWGHDLSAQIGGNQAPGMWMTGGALRLLERSGPGVLFNDLDACNRYVRGPESAARGALPHPSPHRRARHHGIADERPRAARRAALAAGDRAAALRPHADGGTPRGSARRPGRIGLGERGRNRGSPSRRTGVAAICHRLSSRGRQGAAVVGRTDRGALKA